MFNGLLLYVSHELHVNLFIILHHYETLAKCLFQLFKCAIRWYSTKFSPPLKILSLRVKPNKLMMAASIISLLVLMAFLNNLM